LLGLPAVRYRSPLRGKYLSVQTFLEIEILEIEILKTEFPEIRILEIGILEIRIPEIEKPENEKIGFSRPQFAGLISLRLD